jgi:DNA-binding LacI/PurR family transcriptional regulator
MRGPFGVVLEPESELGVDHQRSPGWLDVDHYISRERLLGWLDELGNAGIKSRVVHEPQGSADDAYAATLLLLAQDDPPTALLCFSDVMANGVVRAAESLGLRVPEDLSVVGFDDGPLASRMRPALTTVRQPIAEKGHAAAAALTAMIDRARSGTDKNRARHFLLPTELVVRDSTAPPPNGQPAKGRPRKRP